MDSDAGPWIIRTQELADIALRDPHIGMIVKPDRPPTELPAADSAPSVAQFFDLWYRYGANDSDIAPELRRAYGNSAVRRYTDGFAGLADAYRDRLPAQGDLVDAFVGPYCVDSTLLLMGFHRNRWPALAKVYRVLMFLIRRRLRGATALADSQRPTVDTALCYLRDATAELMATETPTPLVEALRAVADQRGGYVWADVAVISQLLAAGVPQVTTGLGIACRDLYGDPELLRAVRAGEVDAEQVAEESMRLTPPFLSVFGWVNEPCECLGESLAPGTALMVDIPAVNRDVERVPDPDRFCPARARSANYTFGRGTHYCLGANSARLQVSVGLARLAAGNRTLSIDTAGVTIENDGLAQSVRTVPYSY